jgi:hypothetical protein
MEVIVCITTQIEDFALSNAKKERALQDTITQHYAVIIGLIRIGNQNARYHGHRSSHQTVTRWSIAHSSAAFLACVKRIHAPNSQDIQQKLLNVHMS